MQGLGLTGSGLILAGFEGDHVVERSHFHSFDSSHDFMLKISRSTWLLGLCAGGMQGWFVSLCWFGLGLGTVYAPPGWPEATEVLCQITAFLLVRVTLYAQLTMLRMARS